MSITDPADYVTAFMGLPEEVQRTLLSAGLAAQDLSDADLDDTGDVLKEVAKIQGGSQTHFFEMCSGITTGVYLARHKRRK